MGWLIAVCGLLAWLAIANQVSKPKRKMTLKEEKEYEIEG